MKNKYDNVLMKTAYLWSKESYCKRKQVGAVLSFNGRILSTGYNGTIKGSCNECEDIDNNGNMITKNDVVHAEVNALMFAASNGIPTKDCTMYVTLQPCMECAKIIVQSGIKEVVFSETYRITDSVEFLKKHGILIRQLNIQ